MPILGYHRHDSPVDFVLRFVAQETTVGSYAPESSFGHCDTIRHLPRSTGESLAALRRVPYVQS